MLEFCGRKEQRVICVHKRLTTFVAWIGTISEYMGRWSFTYRIPHGCASVVTLDESENRQLEEFLRPLNMPTR